MNLCLTVSSICSLQRPCSCMLLVDAVSITATHVLTNVQMTKYRRAPQHPADGSQRPQHAAVTTTMLRTPATTRAVWPWRPIVIRKSVHPSHATTNAMATHVSSRRCSRRESSPNGATLPTSLQGRRLLASPSRPIVVSVVTLGPRQRVRSLVEAARLRKSGCSENACCRELSRSQIVRLLDSP